MVHFYGWGSTTSRLETHYEEAVNYLQLSSQKFLVLTVSGVSGFNNLTVKNYPSSNIYKINQWSILSILDKIGKKCSPNGNHYIFSAGLTRLTKMLSLSCIYLYILNMYAKTASYWLFELYFFFS